MGVVFDGLTISPGPSGEGAGAVFTLSAPPEKGGWHDEGSARASVTEGSLGVVVSGLTARSYPHAWRDGLLVAQRGLDVLSARGVADLRVKNPQHDHLVVYGEGGGQVLRVAGVATSTFGMSAHGFVSDATGQIRLPEAPISDWHESMRYYRHSQLEDDLFDSFRSLWLALENLLDELAPQKRREREGRWLKRALAKADAAVSLHNFLPAAYTGSPVNAAYTYFYDEARGHLFHAKASRRPHLPYEATGTNLLAERHKRLTDLYLRLLEHKTGVRRGGGTMLMKGGFDLMAGAFEEEPAVAATDDASPFDPDDQRLNPAGGAVVKTTAARETKLERPFLRMYLGRIPGEELRPLKALRRAVLLSADSLVTAHIPDGELLMADIRALELQMGLSITSRGMPRSFPEM